MSLRFIPANQAPTSFSHLGGTGTGQKHHHHQHLHTSSAPSAPGIHDTLRHGLGPNALHDQRQPQRQTQRHQSCTTPATSAHPLEARLRNWDATHDSLRMESLRRAFGMAEPIRRGMELKTVRDAVWRPLLLGPDLPSLHEDILRGRDDTLDWEDVFTGHESTALPGFHDEMEKKCRV